MSVALANLIAFVQSIPLFLHAAAFSADTIVGNFGVKTYYNQWVTPNLIRVLFVNPTEDDVPSG